VPLEEAERADLLLNIAYDAHAGVLDRFPRKAMLDIDPGLTQIWATDGTCPIPEHDLYFTIGETVGRPEAQFPDAGLEWVYTPPCVALDWWPVAPAPSRDAPFTTVTNWNNPEWFIEPAGRVHNNNKRSGFQPYIDLPASVDEPLELALCMAADDDLALAAPEQEEVRRLEALGWHVRHAYEVSATPGDYQRYIQSSRGEFSSAKMSWQFLMNAWVSDRTLCYLASARPAVVEFTGASRFLPDRAGLFRFSDVGEAADCLREAARDWPRHSRLARELAEEHFDARAVTARVLERALGRSTSVEAIG
jgi:hypothetical protein